MLEVLESGIQSLAQYAQIPIAFPVTSIFHVEILDGGLGGFRLVEEPVTPYIKDYNACEEGGPEHWPRQFDITNWGFFLALEGERPIGGAAVAFNTKGINMLEGRRDLSVLWDIRVQPEFRGRGIGRALFLQAAEWSRERGCRQMKVETQNVNVPACRFYVNMGCELGAINRHGYAGQPHVAHEVMFLWYIFLK